MILFIPNEGDVGIFGFLVRFCGFCTEKRRFLGFVGRWCGFRFFGFLAPGFLAKIKQVRFLSESLRSPDVRLFYMFLFYCQSRSNCNVGFWIFHWGFTVGCARLSVSVDMMSGISKREAKEAREQRKREWAKNGGKREGESLWHLLKYLNLPTTPPTSRKHVKLLKFARVDSRELAG